MFSHVLIFKLYHDNKKFCLFSMVVVSKQIETIPEFFSRVLLLTNAVLKMEEELKLSRMLWEVKKKT